mmetsp:Transcript_32295/g.96145  ORF Transcript_32295/g.96145 Transcript_32295/m.96145 type:complete len:252 (+) Transcript_32295:1656-2411(+)
MARPISASASASASEDEVASPPASGLGGDGRLGWGGEENMAPTKDMSTSGVGVSFPGLSAASPSAARSGRGSGVALAAGASCGPPSDRLRRCPPPPPPIAPKLLQASSPPPPASPLLPAPPAPPQRACTSPTVSVLTEPEGVRCRRMRGHEPDDEPCIGSLPSARGAAAGGAPSAPSTCHSRCQPSLGAPRGVGSPEPVPEAKPEELEDAAYSSPPPAAAPSPSYTAQGGSRVSAMVRPASAAAATICAEL